MKLVYIAHPIAPHEEATFKDNIRMVNEIVRRLYLEELGVIPVAPYILPLMLGWDDDEDPFMRARGLLVDCAYVERCDEIWLYGDRISSGMWQEIAVARACGLKVVCKTRATAEAYKAMFGE